MDGDQMDAVASGGLGSSGDDDQLRKGCGLLLRNTCVRYSAHNIQAAQARTHARLLDSSTRTRLFLEVAREALHPVPPSCTAHSSNGLDRGI
jgi:hypothetical protein